MNQRRYEALRAYFVEGLACEQAGARFGYTRWAMVNLVRQHRAGKLDLFAGAEEARPAARCRAGQRTRPGPGDRAAAAGVVQGLSISGRLAAEETPLNRTLGRGNPRRGGVCAGCCATPGPEASISPDDGGPRHQPARGQGDRLHRLAARGKKTVRAGLLLAIPDLAALDLPALVSARLLPAPGSSPQ